MRVRQKNPLLKDTIEGLYRKGIENKTPVWKAVAKALNRPRRKEHKVNIYTIQKHAKADETVLVPGTVLGAGNLDKKLTVAALKFSATAREKVTKTGGTCLTIEELESKNPKGSKIRIMG